MNKLNSSKYEEFSIWFFFSLFVFISIIWLNFSCLLENKFVLLSKPPMPTDWRMATTQIRKKMKKKTQQNH